MTDSPDNLVEARRQIASMCRKLENAINSIHRPILRGRTARETYLAAA